MDSESSSRLSKFYPWFIWIIASSFFFSGYFVRVAPTTMAAALMQDFNAHATFLSILGSSFLCTYIIVQVPVGIVLDKFGAKHLLSIMSFLAGVSCIIFAGAHGTIVASLSRALLGIALAFSFVGAIRLASKWHPSSRLGMIVGMTQACGMLGAFIGSGPVAVAVTRWGWRFTTMVMAGVLIFISALIVVFAKEKKCVNTTDVTNNTTISIKEAFCIVIKNPQSWYNAIFVSFLYLPTGLFSEFLGVLYLQNIHSISTKNAAFLNGWLFIGWIVGGPFWGFISDYIKRRRICMIFANSFSLVIFASLLFIPNIPHFLIGVLLFLLGVANSGVILSYTIATEFNVKKVAATSMSFANMASVTMFLIMMPIVGYVLDFVRVMEDTINYSEKAFLTAFSVCIVGLLIGFIFVFKIKETYCKSVSD